jgi:ADP-L-glycero-D-manno-heptose 6-epimerase
MKILVTGGGGFVGSNLALHLEKESHDVVVLDDFSSGNAENLVDFAGEVISESIVTVNLDKFAEVDVIFHSAAITDTTVTDERLMRSVNVEGFKRFLEFAVKRRKKLVYASSAAVYGSATAPTSESAAGNPMNIYGVSKWESDCFAMDYVKGIPDSHVIGLRYFNVFGNRERYKGKMASMIWQLAEQIRNKRRPRVFKWGEQKRDQVYVKDVVRANILGLSAKRSAVVNIGSGRAVSFNHMIEVLNKVLGADHSPDYFDNPYTEAYQNHTQADLTLAKEVLGYTPEWSFEDAVRDYMRT